MHPIDAHDQLRELRDLPPIDVGAPLPIVLAGEGQLLVTYFLRGQPELDRVALVRFERPYANTFGPPNEEAIDAHPLVARGLRPCAAFEVLSSSWLRTLERANALHPHHDPQRFQRRRHFIFTFHDSTFECIADGYSFELLDAPLRDRIAAEAARLAL